MREGVEFDDPDAVVAAAQSGEAYDHVVDCGTEDGTQPMRVRLAAHDGPTGYVLYSPVDAPTE